MAFMTPYYWYGKMYFCCDSNEGDMWPADDFSIADVDNECPDDVCAETGWWSRLSASGYLDATDWSGPYTNYDEARRYIFDTYEVDPENGMSIDEWEDSESKDYVFRKVAKGSLLDNWVYNQEKGWLKRSKGSLPGRVVRGVEQPKPKKKKTEGDLLTDFLFPPLPKPKGGGLFGIPRSRRRR